MRDTLKRNITASNCALRAVSITTSKALAMTAIGLSPRPFLSCTIRPLLFISHSTTCAVLSPIRMILGVLLVKLQRRTITSLSRVCTAKSCLGFCLGFKHCTGAILPKFSSSSVNSHFSKDSIIRSSISKLNILYPLVDNL